ncbi:unnamed protein product [Diamesa serratosioi]
MSSIRWISSGGNGKNPFRKQTSIADDKPSEGRKVLRKQSSVDNASSTRAERTSSASIINFNRQLWTNTIHQVPSANDSNLKITPSSVLKKREQFASTVNKQEMLNDCINKSIDDADDLEPNKDRININIFLSSDVHGDGDGFSDVEAQAPRADIKHVFHSKNPLESTANTTIVVAPDNIVPTSCLKNISVGARRAQFGGRRTMSAPIRPLAIEDPSKVQGKRKTRRKKVLRDKDEFDDSPDELVDDYEEKKPISGVINQSNIKMLPKQHKPPSRSRSVLGCDHQGIETLVSMLSSGGSDSEKEESQLQKQEIPKSRSQMLRKTVSFQEDGSHLMSSQSKEIPVIYRRNIFAPSAGRMRSNRNIPGQEFINPYMTNSDKPATDKNENDLNSTNKPSHIVKPKGKKSEGSEDKTHDKSPKEQECWRLYQKMKNTGLSVSYETILRGILKPSELRILEKQKKKEQSFLADIQEQEQTVENTND